MIKKKKANGFKIPHTLIQKNSGFGLQCNFVFRIHIKKYCRTNSVIGIYKLQKKYTQRHVMIPLSAEHKIFVGFTYSDYFYYAKL